MKHNNLCLAWPLLTLMMFVFASRVHGYQGLPRLPPLPEECVRICRDPRNTNDYVAFNQMTSKYSSTLTHQAPPLGVIGYLVYVGAVGGLLNTSSYNCNDAYYEAADYARYYKKKKTQ